MPTQSLKPATAGSFLTKFEPKNTEKTPRGARFLGGHSDFITPPVRESRRDFENKVLCPTPHPAQHRHPTVAGRPPCTAGNASKEEYTFTIPRILNYMKYFSYRRSTPQTFSSAIPPGPGGRRPPGGSQPGMPASRAFRPEVYTFVLLVRARRC